MRYLPLILLLALPFPPVAAQSEAPTAASVLAAARQAAGGDAWDRVQALSAEGDEDSGGMKGHWHAVDDVKTGRMRRASDFRIVHTAEVWGDGGHWRQDISGGMHPLDSAFARSLAATDAWMARRDYLKPGFGNAALGAVESRAEGGKTYQVMTVTPQAGDPITLWFDPVTHLLARTARALSTHAESVTYDDYRNVDGLKLPFAIKTDEDQPDEFDTVAISAYSTSSAKADEFAPPEAPDDTTVAGGMVTVPIRFDGEIIVEAMLNGKGPYKFILDTGGHDIVTPDAAKALGLTPEGAGASGGAGEGTLPQQYAKVDTLAIGGVTIRNQTFFVIPFQYNTVDDGDRAPLAGLLGLELFERMAMRLDYVGQTLTFQPLKDYRHSGGGTAVPIRFYDDLPLVDATLDGHPGLFSIDTGNSGTVVVQHIWADRVGIGEAMRHGLELASFGAGGISHNWEQRMDSLKIGDAPPVNGVLARYASDAKGSFASRVEAGNIGNQVLPYFNVTFDYAHEQMWLEPRPGFTPVPASRSGMSLDKPGPDAFTIVTLIDGSPAATAGLKKGDRITAIDGVAAKHLVRHDILMTFTRPAGTAVHLTYERDGKSAEATLVLKTLLP